MHYRVPDLADSLTTIYYLSVYLGRLADKTLTDSLITFVKKFMKGEQRRTKRTEPNTNRKLRSPRIRQEGVASEEFSNIHDLLPRHGRVDIKLNGKERVLLIRS